MVEKQWTEQVMMVKDGLSEQYFEVRTKKHSFWIWQLGAYDLFDTWYS